ncbi:MAG: tetratricopeptide repeat protein [Bacteroidales bacterium]|jgi:AraC-like DNA-binding protein/Tfp pilus assembly protein PilF|nr:tetratricopeptide repeat protein [Bacteroidales bacterium]
MKQRLIFIFIFFSVTIVVKGQISLSELSENNTIVSNFLQLPKQQLLDTAEYYFRKNSIDTALACYNLIVNTPKKNTNIEQQKIVIEAFNRLAMMYSDMSDYRSAYEVLIKALLLCEEISYESFLPRIYNNIGNIYYHFNKYDIAKHYYSKALERCQDSIGLVIMLNNLGAVKIGNKNMDSAFLLLDKALQISQQINFTHLYSIQNNIARLHQERKQYDSAFHYFRLALNNAREKDQIEKEAENLSGLADCFLEVGQIDSVLFYIKLANAIAKEHNFLKLLAKNHLILANLEESKGHNKNALEYFRAYADLRDSVFNIESFGNINQLQHLYETSKTNQHIERLVVEQQIKDRTIHYQKIIQGIIFAVLLLVSIVLLFVFLQKRRLDTAYKVLFDKNLKIIDLENLSKNDSDKYKKSALTHDGRNELLNRILTLMEDRSVICDSELSMDKLAELAKSNSTYVSQVINFTFEKNFRSFLNDYRIREAQRLFSEPNAAKYTIEFVAHQVGFKSRNAFSDAFKEIVGVSPNFYLKSMRDVSRKFEHSVNNEAVNQQ